MRLGLELLEPREVPAVFTVTTNSDVVDANDGVTSLREAVNAANAEPAGQQQLITFAQPTKTFPGLGPTITLNSQLTLQNSIYIAGPGADVLAITRNAAMGDFRLFEVKAGSSSIIGGLKLRGGKAPAGENGGAILDGGNLTVTGCVVRDSTASRGGGIATVAQTLSGGGTQKSALTIYDTVITNNTADFGGGIAVVDGDMTASNGVEISLNTGTFGGGGIYIYKVATALAPQVNLTDIYITQNTTEWDGGGINCAEGAVTLTGGSITFNTAGTEGAERRGGGVFLDEKGTLIAANNPTIGYNTATTGDGMYIKAGGAKSGSITYVDDSEYDGNSA